MNKLTFPLLPLVVVGGKKSFQSATAAFSQTMISRPALQNLANSKFKNIASQSWPCHISLVHPTPELFHAKRNSEMMPLSKQS